MKFARPWMIVAALGAALVVAACGSGSDAPTSKIFNAPAWEGAETATYELLNDRELYGICTLETEPNGDTLTVRRLCGDAQDEGFRDDGMAVVDAETLQPMESERDRIIVDQGERVIQNGEYGDDAVVIEYNQFELGNRDNVLEAFTTERELPEPDEESPDPGYYDDESLFWLLRGIPLEEGWEGAYHNVNLGVARVVVAEVLVEERETVEVPAGEFDTWRIRVRTESIAQRVWIEVDEPHRMIRAEIEDLTYELDSFEAETSQ